MRPVTVTLNIFLFTKTSSLLSLCDPTWHIKAVLFLEDVSQTEKSPVSSRHLYLPDRHQLILTRDGESLESFWDVLDPVHLLNWVRPQFVLSSTCSLIIYDNTRACTSQHSPQTHSHFVQSYVLYGLDMPATFFHLNKPIFTPMYRVYDILEISSTTKLSCEKNNVFLLCCLAMHFFLIMERGNY